MNSTGADIALKSNDTTIHIAANVSTEPNDLASSTLLCNYISLARLLTVTIPRVGFELLEVVNIICLRKYAHEFREVATVNGVGRVENSMKFMINK